MSYLVDYDLARAVCLMPVPVMTGIGHNIDKGIVDEAACMPFDTPSKVVEKIRQCVVANALAGEAAAAESRAHAGALLARGALAVEKTLSAVRGSATDALAGAERHTRAVVGAIREAVMMRIGEADRTVRAIVHAVRAGIASSLANAETLTRHHRGAALAAAAMQVAETERITERLCARSLAAARDLVMRADSLVRDTMTQAASLDPVRVVRAGYAIVRGADGRPLSTAAAIVTEGKVVAQMKDGTVALIVRRGE